MPYLSKNSGKVLIGMQDRVTECNSMISDWQQALQLAIDAPKVAQICSRNFSQHQLSLCTVVSYT